MGFQYRQDIDIIALLNAAGYTPSRIRAERIFGERVMTKFRRKKTLPSWSELEKLCQLLKCKPEDIIIFTE